jgi:hypothetical protein
MIDLQKDMHLLLRFIFGRIHYNIALISIVSLAFSMMVISRSTGHMNLKIVKDIIIYYIL